MGIVIHGSRCLEPKLSSISFDNGFLFLGNIGGNNAATMVTDQDFWFVIEKNRIVLDARAENIEDGCDIMPVTDEQDSPGLFPEHKRISKLVIEKRDEGRIGIDALHEK